VRAEGPRERPSSEVREDIEQRRADLGVYLAEIDRRRHDAFDWRLQLRRRRTAITLVCAGVAAAIGIAVGALAGRRRD
jgi:hypothetical protein